MFSINEEYAKKKIGKTNKPTKAATNHIRMSIIADDVTDNLVNMSLQEKHEMELIRNCSKNLFFEVAPKDLLS